MLEREGLTTVSLTSAIDITERIRPPRAAFLNFPLGNATGSPRDAEGQRRVLRKVLGLAETIREPGTIVELDDRWPDADWEAATVRGYWDEKHIVHDTRLKSEYDGEENYALRECKDVCSLA